MAHGLSGAMVPRTVGRTVDERREARVAVARGSARLCWRGRTVLVPLGNISSEGAMILLREIPRIGDQVALQLPDRAPEAGHVRWVRNGRVGIHFAGPNEPF